MWIQTGVTVRKRLSWVVTSVTLTFDLWPWPFAWTTLLSLAITPENFVLIRWQEHSEKGVTDRQTDRQTDRKRCSWSCLVAAKKWNQDKSLWYSKGQYCSIGNNFIEINMLFSVTVIISSELLKGAVPYIVIVTIGLQSLVFHCVKNEI